MIRNRGVLVAVVAGVIASTPASSHSQTFLYWPVPASGDVRGTFGDYRPEPIGFHEGIDIHGQAGMSVFPPVDVVRVTRINTDEIPSHKGATLYLTDATSPPPPGPIESFRYGHVTTYDAFGRPIELNTDYYWYDPITTIYDFGDDGVSDNDHLHLDLCSPIRNPLWANDNPYRELAGARDDVTPPTIVAVVFAEYFGPYDGGNTLEGDPVELPTSGDYIKYIWDDTDTDIIVWAHDDNGKVGVRALSYAVTDPGQSAGENDWVHFCDFTQGLPDPSDYDLVYAFQKDSGEDVLTAPSPPYDKMWYIVTNTSGTANSFTDNAWRTPRLESDQDQIAKTVHIRATDPAGNTETVEIDVLITPRQGGETPATFWVLETETGILATWTKNSGPPAKEYRIWVGCGGGAGEMLLSVEATARGESRADDYWVELPGHASSPDCVYRLEAITDEGVPVPLAWAKPSCSRTSTSLRS